MFALRGTLVVGGIRGTRGLTVYAGVLVQVAAGHATGPHLVHTEAGQDACVGQVELAQLREPGSGGAGVADDCLHGFVAGFGREVPEADVAWATMPGKSSFTNFVCQTGTESSECRCLGIAIMGMTSRG